MNIYSVSVDYLFQLILKRLLVSTLKMKIKKIRKFTKYFSVNTQQRNGDNEHSGNEGIITFLKLFKFYLNFL